VVDLIHFPFNLRHPITIKMLYQCVKTNRSRSWIWSHEKESSGDGATLMKTKSSGAGAMFMKRRAPEPELCHFYDGSAALK